MVNSKKRDILERYRNLLENNLILTDDLLQWFKSKRVLPDFIFDDIKVSIRFLINLFLILSYINRHYHHHLKEIKNS
jgi:hypothetical protein